MLQDSNDLSEYWMAIGQDRLTTSGLTQTSCSALFEREGDILQTLFTVYTFRFFLTDEVGSVQVAMMSLEAEVERCRVQNYATLWPGYRVEPCT